MANSPEHRGEHEVAVKTIAWGMPGDSGVTCMLVCALPLPLHTRPWAHRAPGIPCALNSERAGIKSKTRGVCAGEIAKVCLAVIARAIIRDLTGRRSLWHSLLRQGGAFLFTVALILVCLEAKGAGLFEDVVTRELHGDPYDAAILGRIIKTVSVDRACSDKYALPIFKIASQNIFIQNREGASNGIFGLTSTLSVNLSFIGNSSTSTGSPNLTIANAAHAAAFFAGVSPTFCHCGVIFHPVAMFVLSKICLVVNLSKAI